MADQETDERMERVDSSLAKQLSDAMRDIIGLRQQIEVHTRIAKVREPAFTKCREERDALRWALTRMTVAFRPFTSRPMGAPNSDARMEQDEQTAAHAHALKVLSEGDTNG